MKKISSKGFRFDRFTPVGRLTLSAFDMSAGAGDVSISMSQAPLHRTDAAVINGSVRFPKGSQKFPRVAGSEGVGTVEVSNSVKFNKGDLVWIAPSNGTWATNVVVADSVCHKIDSSVKDQAAFASCLMTAHYLVGSYKLGDGDFILQNGGSSLTAAAVTALACSRKLNVVTAITPGARFAGAAERQKQLGAKVVEYTAKGAQQVPSITGSGPKLFLNGVGGSSFNAFLKTVAFNGTAVTFGAQNSFGLEWSPSHHVFNSVSHVGFNLMSQLEKLSYEERSAMLDEVLSTFHKLKFQYPVETSTLSNLPQAWDKNYIEGGKKVMIKF